MLKPHLSYLSFSFCQSSWKISEGSNSSEIISQWNISGTFTKRFRDMEPTNSVVKFSGVSVLNFNDVGLIESAKVLFDSADVLKQMGATRKMRWRTVRNM